ncbi:MmgE/PrpD family protein [uncultured Desulfobacterium sp.]|uniref:MmgE/PrpD family protein n=1 Tax=uncultured Desulfobacterium sp. TaxID=201089 RepID=A0A445MW58_9BACT|nr:MmgE/PrpD family protein [uncultured Desulfobacterium sp.]
MDNTTSILAGFIDRVGFDNLPQDIVLECKRILMDSIGCALAGTFTQKGRIAVLFSERFRFPPEATVIGGGEKASVPAAAFANGELFNAMDYDVLCAPSGHITPYVLSAPLAMAECDKSHGRDLITAIAVSHEITQRITSGLVMPRRLTTTTTETGIPISLPIHGYGVNIFGAIAGTSKIMGLSANKIAHAFGIGGSMCPVPTLMQFVQTTPGSMTKFAPSGWISQAGATAAILAQTGYAGAEDVFDGEFAFWKSCAADGWHPDIVVSDIGRSWFFSDTVGYKGYPCCGAMQGALDLFRAIIDKFDIEAQDIMELNVVLNLLAELALWKNRQLVNHIEAQFSTAYVFAAAAHRIAPGIRWQEPENFMSPEIKEFMKRINIYIPLQVLDMAKGGLLLRLWLRKEKQALKGGIQKKRPAWPLK